MALALSIPRHGAVHIGERRITVVATQLSVRIQLDDGKEFELSEESLCEVLPGVRIGLGLRSTKSRPRLTIEAPRGIAIWRDVHIPTLADL